MKHAFTFTLIFSLALLSACGNTQNTPETQEEPSTPELNFQSDFQKQGAEDISQYALTQEEIAAVVDIGEIAEDSTTIRYGIGGRIYTVTENGETVLKMSYSTFINEESLETNYRQLYDATPARETLEFTEDGFFSPQFKKIILKTDTVKIDIRGVYAEYYDPEVLKELAQKAYEKLTQ